MVRKALGFGSVLVVFLVMGMPWAHATAQIRDVDVRRYPDIRVTLSTDSAVGLSASNVRITENGVAVPVSRIRALTPSLHDVDVILAIDVSNSMQGRELQTALAAAKTFVQNVPSWISVGVVSFANDVNVVSPITANHDELASAVASMTATTSQGTALFGAVSQGSAMFDSHGQHNLIVLTDGRNTADGSVADATAAAEDAGVTVFTMGLVGGRPDDEVLRALADQTGGAYQPLSSDDLEAAYKTLAVQLSQQYVVTYRSKVPYGAPASIEVDVPGGSDERHLVMPPRPGAGVSESSSLLERFFDNRVSLFFIVGLAFVAAYMLMNLITVRTFDARRQRDLAARMMADPSASGPIVEDSAGLHAPRQLTEAIEKGAAAAGVLRPVARMIERAGWKISVGEFLLPSLVVPLVLGVLVGALLNPIVGALILVVAVALPFVLLSRAARGRINLLQSQLVDVLMILASSLRAGHSFLQALDSVAKEVEEPAASEFSRVLSEVQLGRTVDDALQALADRVGSQDLDWAVTAIAIQRKVGGNLAEVLETVAGTIRERETIRRQVRVLSAEGRWSVVILILLPFIIVGYLLLVNPSYLSPLLTTPVGRIAMGGGALLMIVGFVWMRKIVRLDA